MNGEIISMETLRLWREQEKENIELQKRIKRAKKYILKVKENLPEEEVLNKIIRILRGEK